MRTTVNLPDELMRTVKEKAEEENTTLREIFHRALRQFSWPVRSRKSPSGSGWNLFHEARCWCLKACLRTGICCMA
jgi:hypothetical protein